MPTERSPERSSWLGLGEASRLLGITPATLRRWTDLGEVAAFVTPGGHRRFPRSVVEALVPRATVARRVLTLRSSLDRMARAYRRARPIAPKPAPSWLADLSQADRDELRRRGHDLLAATLSHLDAHEKEAAAELVRACALAAEYGHRAAQLGASLGETVEGFLRFRSTFVSELAGVARRRRLTTAEATALLVRAEGGLDRLLVELIAGHQQAAGDLQRSQGATG